MAGSAWLEINGEIRCVPRFCLVDSAEYDWQRARIIWNLTHSNPAFLIRGERQ